MECRRGIEWNVEGMQNGMCKRQRMECRMNVEEAYDGMWNGMQNGMWKRQRMECRMKCGRVKEWNVEWNVEET